MCMRNAFVVRGKMSGIVSFQAALTTISCTGH